MQNIEKHNSDIAGLILFYKRNFKMVAGVTLFGFISAIVVSLLITPKYQSQVILYPASATSISKELVTDVSRTTKQFLNFGEEEEAEQMLQLLRSDDIKQRVIQKFNLIEHYDIDLQGSYPYYKLELMYQENVKFRRTEFTSIEITVRDENPQMAADIANEIANLVDTVYNQMQRNRAYQAYVIVENEFNLCEKNISVIQDSLKTLAVMGLYNYEEQISDLNRQLNQAQSNSAMYANLQNKIRELNGIENLQSLLIGRLKGETDRLNLLSSKLMEARVDYQQNLPHKFVVNTAKVSDKKAYPVRWLIVVITSLSVFIFISVSLALFESVRKYL